MEAITIALDVMGGDYGCKVTVPAAILALAAHPEISLILVGQQDLIRNELASCGAKEHARLMIHHASEVVAMDELPSAAVRYKKDSSMRVALNLVKAGKAHACVSAGNTGALVVIARYVLKTLPGIDRPAIVSEMPTITDRATRMLDLGANVDSGAQHLFQFAIMGTVLCKAVDNIAQPRVGLLNIGVEEIKGNEQVKSTADLLSHNPSINYVGYVEGDDIFKGVADLIVCDGFVGNVSLKTSEGLAKLIETYMKQAFNKNILTKLTGLLAWPVLKAFKKRIDPARFNGASLLGLNGIVIKSHGGANTVAFKYAIEKAIVEVKNAVPDLIRQEVAELLKDGTTL